MNSTTSSDASPPFSNPRKKALRDRVDATLEEIERWRKLNAAYHDDDRKFMRFLIPPGKRVLELGCGSGSPETRRLAQRFAVTGVDISPRQVERARAAIPEASFMVADLTELELPPASYDAVVSFYVFNHVPRDLLAPLLGRIRDWLVPGGWLLSAFGVSDLESWTGDWLGAPTFFSSFPAEVNSRLVCEAGFTPERDEVVVFEEPEGQAKFQWVLARA